MLVQTHSQTQQYRQMLPSTFEYPPVRNTHPKIAGEADKIHATEETEQLIEKGLARQRTKMFSQFNDILT